MADMFLKGEDHEGNPKVNRFLTEGCCPNRHGPLIRTARYMAACVKCDFTWRSKRLEQIFPSQEVDGE